MIQFNLLPDVKLEYIKAARTKRLFISLSVLVSVGVIAIVVLMAVYTFAVRGSHLANLSEDVKTRTSNLTSTEDIDKILTIQNQLSSLPNLHNDKPRASATFAYLSQLTPEDISINDLEIDFVNNTISITGESTSLPKLNTFVDTIKFTELIAEAELEPGQEPDPNAPEPVAVKAFSEVVLDSFSLDEDKKVSFDIKLKFDEMLFSNTQKISLKIPNKFSTRSEVEKPIFQKPTIDPAETTEEQ